MVSCSSRYAYHLRKGPQSRSRLQVGVNYNSIVFQDAGTTHKPSTLPRQPVLAVKFAHATRRHCGKLACSVITLTGLRAHGLRIHQTPPLIRKIAIPFPIVI